MRILICSGIYPPDVGGPAKYAKNLTEEFLRNGHQAKVLFFKFEKRLPIGARHLWYFFRVCFNLYRTDLIIALDIFSTGFPAVLAGKLFRKKTILRVGGDFLWETYVEKTGHLIKLPDFYARGFRLPLKHKIIKWLQKFTLENAGALAFNSNWQRELFTRHHNLSGKKSYLIENFYGQKLEGNEPTKKNFLFAGRKIKFKNLALAQAVFGGLKDSGAVLEIVDNLPSLELAEKIKNAYALLTLSISDFAPNFIIEGITMGKPFILTKDCGLAERVGGLGELIDATSSDEIKRAVLSLLGTNVYDGYKKKINDFRFVHSWSDIADEFLSIGKDL